MGTPRDLPEKSCATCGRAFAWRKSWSRDWDSVRYCSKRCRSERPTSVDESLEQAILDLLSTRSRGATVCPSEAARRVEPEAWRELMERTRRAARRLEAEGEVIILQKGRRVDPGVAGPIRIGNPT